MRLEAGKEVEFVDSRLKDILFFVEKTQPVDGGWEGYAKSLRRMIGEQATEARAALALVGTVKQSNET